ncbi:hypothetical protein Skr01_01150 [Sphaerisporangium krabiense]|uniref:DUF3043 domain-containing protein n=1 Tax=Sphaerisporangium krabiense TaxID=763782 RepID=A0A7W8Z884_9ACTN|nr:DUF3043 domain-containing protein [Sphaerisporangium krabiense]MBB5629130.1 hypothetical protein [Sphaerisporangium krabiense]GII60030.1 hypothetical protein Skr01_01150 [Sphaerisporangium krabiense]
MFRRRTEAPADASAPAPEETQGKTAGKGRPTPKRREAQGRRRSPVTAPTNRKEAYRQARERQTAERARAREGMLRGDDRYLPVRDRGQARKFARDWVDSRRTVSQYFLPVSLLLLVVLWTIPMLGGQTGMLLYSYAITILWPAMIVVVALSGFWVARRVKKEAGEKFPGESLKGVGFYAAMRAMQIRRLRFPPPTLLPGGRPVPPKK